MKIRLFSDLHLEFGGFDIPSLPDDKDTLLLLAGDIAIGKKKHTYLDFLADAVDQFRKIIYIPGNHEYYHGSHKVTWNRMQEHMVEKLRDQGFDAYLHMINMRTVVDGDVVIIGATMWTDFDRQHPLTMEKARTYMNDYKAIRRGDEKNDYAGRLRPMDVLKEHNQAKVFIFEECRKWKAEGKKVIVMTHHAPSFQSIHKSFKGDEMNGCYASELAYDIMDLDDLGLAPDFWVHGHVHNTFDYNIGSTRVLVNPRGYTDYDGKAGPENRKFDPTFCFEV